MSDEVQATTQVPGTDTMDALPRYFIMPECGTSDDYKITDDPVQAEEITREYARQNPGKYVAIYQRVMLIRKSC